MLEKIKRIFYRGMNRDEKSLKEINYKTMQEMLKEEDTVLLDVRSIQEYKEGHLAGAICVSLYELNNKILTIIPNKKTKIIVYCASGIRSKKAKDILEKLGYEEVYDLQGGLNGI